MGLNLRSPFHCEKHRVVVLHAWAEMYSNCLLEREGTCCLLAPTGLDGDSSRLEKGHGMEMVAMGDKHGMDVSVLDLGPLSCVFFDDGGVPVLASVLEEVGLPALDQNG